MRDGVYISKKIMYGCLQDNQKEVG